MSNEPKIWNLAQIWNACAYKEDRPLKPRDYVYASEIGSPFCDRILKMKGVEYSNPPNERSRRKFLAGNIMEYVVKMILISSGIYKQEEVKVDATPYRDCLQVHGRLDFIAGGYIDGDAAMSRLHDLNLPDYLFKVGQTIIETLDGNTLVEKILELKAVSTFAMDRVEKSGCAIPNHTLQGFHYQKNGNIPVIICYVCKDDCRMSQFDVDANVTEPIYKQDIQQITEYYKDKRKKPPLEPLAKFDELRGVFMRNLGVEYSPYLTKLYNIADADEYRQQVAFLTGWNRTLTRYVKAELGEKTPTGKPIMVTPKNRETLDEIINAGYKLKELADIKIKLGAISDEEEQEAA